MLRVALLGLIATACGGKPECALAPRPAIAPAPFLWKVQRADGPIVWLYGTIHNGSTEDVPRAAWTALESSARFVSELGDREPDPDQAGELARLPPGKGLDTLLPPDDWYDLRDAMRGAIKEADLKRMRPWYAMTRLMARLSPPPQPTMDFAMTNRAKAKHIPIDNLESWDVQLAALAEAVKVPDLQQAIHARNTLRCELDQMRALYLTGDLPTMKRLLVDNGSDRLLTERTKVWLGKLEPYLATGGAFVAVGLGHLAGDNGLPAMLERAGYTVTRTGP